MRASREVRDELEVRNDDCFQWVKEQPSLFVDSDAKIQNVVTQLMGQYFDPNKPDKGISGADPFVRPCRCSKSNTLGGCHRRKTG